MSTVISGHVRRGWLKGNRLTECNITANVIVYNFSVQHWSSGEGQHSCHCFAKQRDLQIEQKSLPSDTCIGFTCWEDILFKMQISVPHWNSFLRWPSPHTHWNLRTAIMQVAFFKKGVYMCRADAQSVCQRCWGSYVRRGGSMPLSRKEGKISLLHPKS